MTRLDALLAALADPAPGGLARADLLAAARRELEAQDAAQAQALAAARFDAEEKARFIAVLSHEIRTPLNGVLAVAELLEREALPAAAAGYARTVADASRTLLRVLSDALDLHRGGGAGPQGGLPLSPAPEPLRPLLDELEALWRPRAAAEGARLHVSYAGDPTLAVMVDGVRLRQVLNNLVGNALKFAGAGVVEASLSAKPEAGGLRVCVEVRDTGPGVDPDMLERVFEPFVQSELGRSMGGAGLGLAVSRRVAHALGGRLWARNNAGRGACFALELVLPKAGEPAEAPAAVADAGCRLGRPAHVLVVDDNATNRMVAQTLCRIFGASTETASDGAEAVEMVRDGAFDLVLMDIRMPRMDGVEATRAIRALPGPAASTPVVALTANVEPEAARSYLAAGMRAVVEKPIQSERLLAAMREALEAGAAGQGVRVRAA